VSCAVRVRYGARFRGSLKCGRRLMMICNAMKKRKPPKLVVDNKLPDVGAEEFSEEEIGAVLEQVAEPATTAPMVRPISSRSRIVHRHGPHHRALSRPGAAYQPRADVAGLAELTCGSDEADNGGNGDGHGDTGRVTGPSILLVRRDRAALWAWGIRGRNRCLPELGSTGLLARSLQVYRQAAQPPFRATFTKSSG
jgi:hypothetical protein